MITKLDGYHIDVNECAQLAINKGYDGVDLSKIIDAANDLGFTDKAVDANDETHPLILEVEKAADEMINNGIEFEVSVSYTYRGTFKIKAKSLEDAKEIASKNCGMTLNSGVHSNDDDVIDWDFPSHADSAIIDPSVLIEQNNEYVYLKKEDKPGFVQVKFDVEGIVVDIFNSDEDVDCSTFASYNDLDSE